MEVSDHAHPDLERFIKEEVVEPEGDEAKAKYKKDMIKAEYHS